MPNQCGFNQGVEQAAGASLAFAVCDRLQRRACSLTRCLVVSAAPPIGRRFRKLAHFFYLLWSMESVRSDSTPPAPLCSRFLPRLPAFACMTCVAYGHILHFCYSRPPETTLLGYMAAVAFFAFSVCDRRGQPCLGTWRRSHLPLSPFVTAGCSLVWGVAAVASLSFAVCDRRRDEKDPGSVTRILFGCNAVLFSACFIVLCVYAASRLLR